jgi:hypothetical protein
VTVLKDLAASKKFVVTGVAAVTTVLLAVLHVLTLQQAEAFLTILIPAYLASQGVADIGAKRAEADKVAQQADTDRRVAIFNELIKALPTIADLASRLSPGGKTVLTPHGENVLNGALAFLREIDPTSLETILNHAGLSPDLKAALLNLVKGAGVASVDDHEPAPFNVPEPPPTQPEKKA